MTTNDFAHIGLIVITSFLFALGTGILGVLIPDDYDDWSLTAWLIGSFVYGITFSILYQMR